MTFPLHDAACLSTLKDFKQLLSRNPDAIYEQSQQELTVAHCVLMRKNGKSKRAILKFLAAKFPMLFCMPNRYNAYPIHYAAAKESLKVFEVVAALYPEAMMEVAEQNPRMEDSLAGTPAQIALKRNDGDASIILKV